MRASVWAVVLIIYESFLNGVLSFVDGIQENRNLPVPEKYDDYIAPLGKPLPNRLHMRVGTITKVALHPNDSSIYVHDILLSLDPIKRRRTVSSLVKYYHPVDLINKNIIVAVNVKLFMYQDIGVEVVLVCATSDPKDPARVEIIEAPEPIYMGEKAFFSKHQYGRPDPDILNSTRRLWATLQGGMSIDSNRVVQWEDHEMRTLRGIVKVSNITHGYVKLCNLLNY